jgi:peptidyl-tRNA hydrolase
MVDWVTGRLSGNDLKIIAEAAERAAAAAEELIKNGVESAMNIYNKA